MNPLLLLASLALAGEPQPPAIEVGAPRDLVDIDMDCDRDGKIPDAVGDLDGDGQGEEPCFAVVSDQEKVYEGTVDRARRRALVVRLLKTGGAVRLKSRGIRLYAAETGGPDLLDGAGEYSTKGGVFWVGGGPAPDEKSFITARRDTGGEITDFDVIRGHVIWVELTARNTGNMNANFTGEIDPNAIKETYDNRTELGLIQTRPDPAADEPYGRLLARVELEGKLQPKLMPDSLKPGAVDTITTGIERGSDMISKAKFGFSFRRMMRSKTYEGDMSTPPNPPPTERHDDSMPEFMDVTPEAFSMIFDQDGPGTRRIVAESFHMRFQAREWAVFFFHDKVPERCSKEVPWGATLDLGRSYADRICAILEVPNDGKDGNEAMLSHPSLELKLKKPKLIDAGPRKIKAGARIPVVVKGENLSGAFWLKRGTRPYPHKKLRFKADTGGFFADGREVTIELEVPATPAGGLNDENVGPGWELSVENAGGTDKLDGFEIVK